MMVSKILGVMFAARGERQLAENARCQKAVDAACQQAARDTWAKAVPKLRATSNVVRFSGQWYRAHGNENWKFDADGYMAERHASINDVPIADADRKFHWDRSGPRPADHPGLSELGM